MKSADVVMAPVSTSRHLILASGSTLKITPNKSVVTAKVMMRLTIYTTATVMSGKKWYSLSLSASTRPVMTSDTRSRKPSPTTTEKESTRFMSIFNQPFFGLGLRFQIILIESWISEKTLVAPTTRVTKPIVALTWLLPLSEALLMMPWICAA